MPHTETSSRAMRSSHPARNLDPSVVAPPVSPLLATPPPQLPDESESDYNLLLLYFRHGATQTQAQIAAKAGVSPATVSRLLHRYHWVDRIQLALSPQPQDSPPLTSEWASRREKLRQVEWDLHLDLIAAGKEALQRWRSSDAIPSPGEVVKFLELAEKLGRLSSGLPLTHTEITGEKGGPIRVQFLDALKRVYGKPSTPELNVQSTVASVGADQPLSNPQPECP